MFHIHSISSGWILGQISDGNNTHHFDNSYLTNFLDDFMLALLTVGGQWPADEGKHEFRTELEPAIEHWTLSRNLDQLHIHIKTYEDEATKVADEEVTLVCDYRSFLAEFISEMERVLSIYGLVGYRENWTFEFPVSLYLKLKDIAGDKNNLSYRTLSAEDNCGCEVRVTDYTAEKDLL